MELKQKTTVASVDLFNVTVSEDELSVLEGALEYMLVCATEGECVSRSGATRDELQGMKQDIRKLLHNDAGRSKGKPKSRNGAKTRRRTNPKR